MPRFAAKKAPGRRTLPPWPEPINFPQYNPVRFVLAEPEAKSQLIKLLATGCICTLLGISWGLGFAAWLQTPQPWLLAARLAAWWLG